MKPIPRMFSQLNYNTHDGSVYLYPYQVSTYLGGRYTPFNLMSERLCMNMIAQIKETVNEITI